MSIRGAVQPWDTTADYAGRRWRNIIWPPPDPATRAKWRQVSPDAELLAAVMRRIIKRGATIGPDSINIIDRLTLTPDEHNAIQRVKQ